MTNHKPIAPGTVVKTKASVLDIADKGKGALLTVGITLSCPDSGDLLSEAVFKFFIRGLGGFGDKGKLKDTLPKVPKGKPSFETEEPTEEGQAILYRLSGDINPLHIDPNMAAMGGFDKPILHGLCTYGVTARAIFDQVCAGNPAAIKTYQARFTSHVFPGETLVVKAWTEGREVIFETSTKERGKAVMVGRVELSADAKI